MEILFKVRSFRCLLYRHGDNELNCDKSISCVALNFKFLCFFFSTFSLYYKFAVFVFETLMISNPVPFITILNKYLLK